MSELTPAQQAHYDRIVADEKWKADERRNDHRLKKKGGIGNVDTERSLLLIACNESENALAIGKWLSGDDFVVPDHGRMWNAILARHAAGKPATSILDAAVDANLIPDLAIKVLRLGHARSPSVFQELAEQVSAWSKLRKAAQANQSAWQIACKAENPRDALRDVQAALPGREALEIIGSSKRTLSARETAQAALARYSGESVASARVHTTGLPVLDEMLGGGTRDGHMVVVAARPGVGKTALALQMAVTAAQTGRVYYALRESTVADLTDRGIALVGRMSLGQLMARTADSFDVAQAVEAWAKLDLHIDDRSETLPEIMEQAMSHHRERPLSMVVVDYIQRVKVTGKFDSREQAVSAISRELADVAKVLGCPVIALSQFNNRTEETLAPRTSDLRESGAIEQDASVILMLWHPEGKLAAGKVDLIIGKNRTGRMGKIALAFNGDQQRFDPRTEFVVQHVRASKTRNSFSKSDD
jgi:replicative DNA helicase